MNFNSRICLLFLLFLWTFTNAHTGVRLVGGNNSHGRVEVFLEDTWKTTVTQYWSKLEGGVVCRQLGFGGVHSVTHDEPTEDMNQATELIIKCEGYESSLLECAQFNTEDYQDSFYSYVQYFSKNIAQVTCKNSTFEPPDNVRLVDGDGFYGTVEARFEGIWHRTCDDQWTKLEGGVICRQLGYRGVYSVVHNPTHENETTTNHFVRFICHGYEESLEDCVQHNLASNLSNNIGGCESEANITCLLDMSMPGTNFTLPSFELAGPSSENVYEKKAGDKLTLRCNVTGATEILWKHRTWSRTKPVTNSNVLRLENISLLDHGSYYCFARGSRGQIIESKPQFVIITNYAQVILTIRSTVENPSEYSSYVARNAVMEQVSLELCVSAQANLSVSHEFRKTAFSPVSVGLVNKSHFSLQLAHRLRAGVHHNHVTNQEIDDLVADLREFWTNSSIINNAAYWIRGLTFCIGGPEDTFAGVLTFPSTVANSTVLSYESCLTSSDLPRASRSCEGDFVTVAKWEDFIVHSCFDELPKKFKYSKRNLVERFFRYVEGKDLSLSNVTAISYDLADLTGSDAIKTEDLDQVAIILKKISKVKSSSPAVTRNVLKIVDNVVTILTDKEGITIVPEISSLFLTYLEEQLETAQKSGFNFSDNKPNIAVEVVQIQNFDLPITFASLKVENDSISETKLYNDSVNLNLQRIQASIQIPSSITQKNKTCILSGNTNNTTFPVVFIVFRNGALFNDPQAAKNRLKRDSWVISASTLCEVSNLSSEHLVLTQFSPLKRTQLDDGGKCVFWDHNRPGGGWSTKGCSRNRIEKVQLYQCSCNHLPKFANFAVLIDVKGNINSLALFIFTVVGCLASICGLIITIMSYLSIKKFRKSQPKKITVNLCVALIGLYCSFSIGINLTYPRTICIIFGGIIHLFCLSSMAWMSVEATQLYLFLVKVLNTHVSNFLKTAALIAWGLPTVVVVICVAVRPDDYGHEHCFPKSSSLVFYIGVIGLLALMLAYNIVIYITIIWNLRAARRNISRSQINRTGVVGRIQNAFAISVLVGLSWCFGFLQVIESLRFAFNVLFCLFNSFQGVFIFLIFCLREKEVRTTWRNWLGTKTCLTKRAENASLLQDKRISITKDGTTENETKRKTASKASVEVQQFELMEAEDNHHGIQTTATSTSQLQDITP